MKIVIERVLKRLPGKECVLGSLSTQSRAPGTEIEGDGFGAAA